jgi:FkbM family methyltransferase
MRIQAAPLARAIVSYLPNPNLLALRRIAGLPDEWRRRPHEDDYMAFRALQVRRILVIDVGANRGQAIGSFMSVLEDPLIHSFEPNPYLASYLTKRFANSEVTVYPFGIGSQQRIQSLYIPRYGNTLWDTRASLSREEAEMSLTPADFWPFRESRRGIESVDVTVRMLDEFHLAPHILKVDVEGTEDDVIVGARETIEKHLPIILVEGSAASSQDWLAQFGYQVHRFESDQARFVGGVAGDLNSFLMTPQHRKNFPELDFIER